jgi:multiple sugar transport system substrate-binding protein
LTRRFAALLVLALATLAGSWWISRGASTSPAAPIEITLNRFFGGCSDEYGTQTDVSRARGECGVIQTLTNQFNAEHAGRIHVRTQTTEWSAYYDRLGAAIAGRHPPDVAVMHRSVLPAYAKRGLLNPLGPALRNAGVEWEDVLPVGRDGVTVDGLVYGLPFDLHALLWHVNGELFVRAGLTDARGRPILPRTPSELVQHARQMKLRTGRRYFAIPSRTDPMPGWNFAQWVWQQNAELLAPDLKSPRLHSEAAQRALELMSTLYRERFADPSEDYAGAEESFLSGRAAVILNGTWTVDAYSDAARKPASALKRYYAMAPPQLFAAPAAWSDSHVWVIPRSEKRSAEQNEAAVLFLAFLFRHNAAWARTGHLPVRKSVLESRAFLSLPERADFADTARIARGFQPIERERALQDVLVQEINATWLRPRTPEESLEAAQKALTRALR